MSFPIRSRKFKEVTADTAMLPTKLSNLDDGQEPYMAPHDVGSANLSPFRPVGFQMHQTLAQPPHTVSKKLFDATRQYFQRPTEPELAFDLGWDVEAPEATIATCQHCSAQWRECMQCGYCAKLVCAQCARQCTACHDVFCPLCATEDYSGLYDQSICLDCRDDRHDQERLKTHGTYK
ncbi:hypothetical protein J8273_3887 [Carpediemonas membranifera]|uniref:Uncharacterized protein n=1 Tax=Carpediemonas membranifera TaxID=201153 RepID=A0A8J6AUP0_9EUKA|nr:hypothetical protein J8273_3887 [Carpediemonas membranifera]|eukprot:KAG9394633.1 hypothetical protein J8273_3887 [Carpediemonas membranifera]